MRDPVSEAESARTEGLDCWSQREGLLKLECDSTASGMRGGRKGDSRATNGSKKSSKRVQDSAKSATLGGCTGAREPELYLNISVNSLRRTIQTRATQAARKCNNTPTAHL